MGKRESVHVHTLGGYTDHLYSIHLYFDLFPFLFSILYTTLFSQLSSSLLSVRPSSVRVACTYTRVVQNISIISFSFSIIISKTTKRLGLYDVSTVERREFRTLTYDKDYLCSVLYCT
jgi:hypothetical protein